jgi:hypothetical protein
MFFITQPEERPGGYVVLSESRDWVRWLHRNIPQTLHRGIRRRLASNLKHLLVGLELKAALIEPHHHRGRGERPLLFEPYFQNLILEFCVAAFSVIEGLGSAHWLARNDRDGRDGPAIHRNRWLPALCAVYDEQGELLLRNAVEVVLEVRDKLNQDRLGARQNIDWHAFSYDGAFVPGRHAIRTILRREAELVPETSNLHREWDRR